MIKCSWTNIKNKINNLALNELYLTKVSLNGIKPIIDFEPNKYKN